MAKKTPKPEPPSLQPTEVRKARKAQLQEWCRAFDLDEGGTVPVLRERLLAHLEEAEEEYLEIEEEPPEAEEEELPPREEGQVYVYGLDGGVTEVVDLPPVFGTPVRTDVIRRAVDAFRANRRQPYGAKPLAGLRHSVEWWGKGRGVSRVPRIKDSRRGAQAPGTVGGRRAHPPRAERDWSKKLNQKERQLARRAALAAVADPERVRARGHRLRERLSVPLVLADEVESLTRTQDALALLERLGLGEDLDRAAVKKVRAGRGKMRGRRYRRRKGPLVVLSPGADAVRAFRNVPGVDVVDPANLNAETLAPGGHPGRLTLFSKNALEMLRGW